MAKITRTFRFDEGLMKQFDKAVKEAGIDKTSVLTEAIQKFISKEDLVDYKELFFYHMTHSNAVDIRKVLRNAIKKIYKDEGALKRFDIDVYGYAVINNMIELHEIFQQEMKAVEMNNKLKDIDFAISHIENRYDIVIYDIENVTDEEDKIATIDCKEIDELYRFYKEDISEVELQKKIIEKAITLN